MWTVVSMLAVTKAGGAFALLDASHPSRRLEAMVRELGAEIMLTSTTHLKLSLSLSRHVVVVNQTEVERLESDAERVGQVGQAGQVEQQMSSAAALYVVFTSGSTGLPKGVVIGHSNYCSGMVQRVKAMGFEPTSRVLDFASYSFDMAIDNMLTTLSTGGCVCVPSDSERKEDTVGAMNRLNVNIADLTPSVARLMAPDAVPGLRVLILIGEAMTATDVSTWARQLQLINAYGPAECSLITSANTSVTASTHPGNIGRGLGAVMWVTDATDHNRLLPVGAVGELLIEGPILARGYLNDEEKTAAAFIEDPAWLLAGVGGRPGRRGRLYKTGDLVRYNPDGTLSFVGRKDTQVKLRGQRIELGEVEHRLRQSLPARTEVAAEVITPAGKGGQPALVAFVAVGLEEMPQDGVEGGAWNVAMRSQLERMVAGLDEKLADCLPAYMVPSAYIPVRQMPMTVSAKTDRKRLREIGSSLSAEQLAACGATGDEKRAPSTEMERRLQTLWATTLSLDPETIGGGDSFFRMGGDSISAMKLVGAARLEGLSLTVADVFRNPRLSDMAVEATSVAGGECKVAELASFSLLDGHSGTEALCEEAATQCNVDSGDIQDMYPCTPLQEGLMALSIKRAGAYIGRIVIELPQETDLDRFEEAWEAVAAAIAPLRTRIIQTAAYGFLQLTVDEQIKWARGNRLDEYLEEDAQVAIGFGARLTRYAIIADRAGKKHHFVWTAHHAIYDGWSVQLILDKVDQVYQGARIGRVVGFNHFVKYLGESDVSVSEAFWRSQLADADGSVFPALPTPMYQPRAEASMEHQAVLTRRPQSNITTSTIIRAAWSILVARLTGSSDAVFGATVTGRNAPVPGVEEMMGPTISTVPIRIRVDRGLLLTEFLDKVQAQSVDMIPFEHTGLQNIRQLGADAQAACAFQTLLVIQPKGEDKAGAKARDSLFGVGDFAHDQSYFNTYAVMLVCSLAQDGGCVVEASFDRSVIDAAQAERLLQQFECVMQQLCLEEATRQVGEVECMSEKEKEEIWDWNDAVPEAVDALVHQLIEQQVHIRPNSPAVCSWDGELTYGELNRLSSKLATHLVGLGVGPEVM
ncbi:MAG: hypothetical protein L6R40_008708, partial [Gallowayella cf. fulva]